MIQKKQLPTGSQYFCPERKMDMTKKYIGWGMTTLRGSQKLITIIPAKSKKVACEIFEGLGMPVISKNHIRKVCVVKYPGTDDVKKLKAAKWNKIQEINPK